MQRYTKSESKVYVLNDQNGSLTDDIVLSSAIKRLAAFENFLEDLISEQTMLITQMEQLRASDKSKTATFRQLLANKMLNQTILQRVETYLNEENKN